MEIGPNSAIHLSFRFPSHESAVLKIAHHGAELLQVPSSTTIVPVMRGCTEQKYS
jgi:hypothetical protein